VDDAGAVSGVGPLSQCLQQSGRLFRRQGASREALLQGAAGDKFHDAERPALMLADLEYLHDIGMLQAGNRLGLRAEARQGLRVSGRPWGDHLERHQAAELALARLVDDAHAAPAQFLQDFVTGNVEPGDLRGRCRTVRVPVSAGTNHGVGLDRWGRVSQARNQFVTMLREPIQVFHHRQPRLALAPQLMLGDNQLHGGRG
jgi:hypothetical protein